MERIDKIGLGIASAGHVLLFAALSTTWLSKPMPLATNPIEVSIADEVAFQSAARKLSETPPPPAPGELKREPEEPAPSPDETVAAVPDKAEPAPLPKPEPRKIEKPKTAPAKPSASDAKPAKSRGSGLKLDTSDWVKSDSRSTTPSKATDGAVAATIGPAQQSALAAEIRRQIKPFWKAPTGADADLLRTTVSVRLGRDGSLAGDPQIVETTGVTASNSAQVHLHQEQAIKAVRLAAPFRLPPALYDGWKSFTVNVDRKLSQ